MPLEPFVHHHPNILTTEEFRASFAELKQRERILVLLVQLVPVAGQHERGPIMWTGEFAPDWLFAGFILDYSHASVA